MLSDTFVAFGASEELQFPLVSPYLIVAVWLPFVVAVIATPCALPSYAYDWSLALTTISAFFISTGPTFATAELLWFASPDA